MKEQMQKRTKQIELARIKRIDGSHQPSAWVISKQIMRSATAIGANYRATGRAKSIPDCSNKLKIVEEKAKETPYWVELLEESKLVHPASIEHMKKEISRIIPITGASIKTMREKATRKSKIATRKP